MHVYMSVIYIYIYMYFWSFFYVSYEHFERRFVIRRMSRVPTSMITSTG